MGEKEVTNVVDTASTIQQKEAFKNLWKNSADTNDTPVVQNKTTYELFAETHKLDHEAINSILLTTLDPHLSKNEEQKRDFKKSLVGYIKWVLSIQFVVAGLPIVCILLKFIFCPSNVQIEQLTEIFSFMRFYITAIIMEFIAMLFFIVKYVFDKSIVDLTKEIVKK